MWICPACGEAASFDDCEPWPLGWRCGACKVEVEHRDHIPCLAPALIGTDSGFNPSYFDKLIAIEETNFWFVNRARLIVAMLAAYAPQAREVLEIGCGNGSVLLALRRARPGLRLTGSELHPEGLAFACGRLGSEASLLQMDARTIPARDHFDVVGAFDVIEHIADEETVLRAIFAALKPQGCAIIAVPQHPWLWSPFDVAARHERRYRRGELETKLVAAGFDILHSTSFNAVLLPLMVASRMLMNRRAVKGAAVDALAETVGPTWLNAALSALLRVEVALSAAGVRWPVGGSRFVVARKQ